MRFVQAGMLLLGAALGAVLFFGFSRHWGSQQLDLIQPIFFTWNAVYFAVTILVIVDSVTKARRGKTMQLATGALVVKVAAIPFLVLSILVSAGASALSWVLLSIFRLGLAVWIVVAISVLMIYGSLLTTSIYGWVTVIRMRVEGRLSTVRAVLYAILLFGFVTDVVVGILVFAHSRRRRRPEREGGPAADPAAEVLGG